MTAVVQSIISPQETQGGQSKYPFLSAAIPLSHRVPSKVKNKIWANEFVDFVLLLNNSIRNSAEEQYTLKIEASKSGQPSLVLAPNNKRQTVNTIDQWVLAFQTYVAIYAEPASQGTPALMKYGSVIRELATLEANWRFYDTIFANLGSHKGLLGTKFILSYGYGPIPFKLNQPFPRRNKQEGPYIPRGFSLKYHRGLHCSGCSYFRCG